MGTHPIFESDFDCLTEMSKSKSLVLTLSVVAVSALQSSFTTSCPDAYNEPIDFVYTWVNGSEPDFLVALAKYTDFEPDAFDNNRMSNNRYADFDQLKYSLRSIEKYAPWANHIHIVTNGQVPDWLNLNNPDVSIVSHKDIFRIPAHLPTFQSNAIEVNLHRVPNLTEKFVYFNDDMGLISPTCPSNFWTKEDGYFMFPTMEVKCRSKCTSDLLMNGECNKECNTRECAYDNGECVEKNIENGLDLDPDKEYMPDFSGRDSNHKAKLAYANYKLTTKFGGVRRPNHPHIPIMINRDIFDELEQTFLHEYSFTTSHKTRNDHDMIYQFTYVNYLREMINADGSQKYKTTELWDAKVDGHINLDSNNESNIKQIDKLLGQMADGEHDSMVFLCVQDKIDHDIEGAEQVEDTVKELFYEKLFPNQSVFEKGSEWDLANPLDEYEIEGEEVAVTEREKTTQTLPTLPPTNELVSLSDDEELFYACAKYIGFVTLSCLFITKFICTKNSTLRRVRLL